MAQRLFKFFDEVHDAGPGACDIEASPPARRQLTRYTKRFEQDLLGVGERLRSSPVRQGQSNTAVRIPGCQPYGSLGEQEPRFGHLHRNDCKARRVLRQPRSLEGMCDLFVSRSRLGILGIAMHEQQIAWVQVHGRLDAREQVARHAAQPPQIGPVAVEGAGRACMLPECPADDGQQGAIRGSVREQREANLHPQLTTPGKRGCMSSRSMTRRAPPGAGTLSAAGRIGLK
jgi:hypothetical protein